LASAIDSKEADKESTMSSFLFTEEQEMFRETVRRLATRAFRDSYLERARSERFPSEAYAELAANGLLGLGLPTDLGGSGADAVTMGLAVEEIARADFNMGMLIFYGIVGAGLAAALADEGERRDWTRGVASGEKIVCGAFTEPGGGSDLAALRLRAMADGDGWRLTGEKTSVTLGPHADAAVVLATTDPTLGTKAIEGFLVDLDDPSIAKQRFRDPGMHPLGRSALTFDGTFVARSRRVGRPGKGLAYILGEFEFTRTLLALIVIGVAERAIEITIDWVKNRRAFGQPIASYQGVSFPLAERKTYIEAGRWLCYRALGLRAAGRSCRSEAAMVKWWLPQVATQTVNDCIVLHGHTGWSEEMPLFQMLADVSGLQIGDGTPQIQKLVIARELIGREWVG
jgi:cyclohexanecarboxyl-CoA dehydrogenase